MKVKLRILLFMKSYFCLLFAMYLLLSCNSGNNGENKDLVHTNSIQRENASNYSSSIKNVGDTAIHVQFKPDSTSKTVTGKLDGIRKPINVYILVKQGDTLHAALQPLDPALNIRINQIIMPDNKADGPFGHEINYPLTQQGVYKLILGSDLMAEGDTTGNFKLNIIIR